jgi:cellulose biosynthesis protein BcsQ
MIVVCGGIKGGSGKTTVATNLAVMRARAGADVLLIDADDQETSFDFTVLRYRFTRITQRRQGDQRVCRSVPFHPDNFAGGLDCPQGRGPFKDGWSWSSGD